VGSFREGAMSVVGDARPGRPSISKRVNVKKQTDWLNGATKDLALMNLHLKWASVVEESCKNNSGQNKKKIF
jgi:hypothetical protein